MHRRTVNNKELRRLVEKKKRFFIDYTTRIYIFDCFRIANAQIAYNMSQVEYNTYTHRGHND